MIASEVSIQDNLDSSAKPYFQHCINLEKDAASRILSGLECSFTGKVWMPHCLQEQNSYKSKGCIVHT